MASLLKVSKGRSKSQDHSSNTICTLSSRLISPDEMFPSSGRSGHTEMTLTDESCKDVSVARKPLARLRCLKESLDCLRNNKPLPRALCYVPAEIEHVPTKNSKVVIYSLPSKSSKKLAEVMCTTEHRVFVSGEELFNASGQWGKLIKIMRGSRVIDSGGDEVRWILLCGCDVGTADIFQPKLSAPLVSTVKQSLFCTQPRYIYSWEDVLEHEYALRLTKTCRASPADESAVDKLSLPPLNWSLAHYEQMTKLLSKITHETSASGGLDLGSVKDFVESLEVSSSSGDSKNNLTDSNPSTYWESSGTPASHWIRLKMKLGTILRKLILVIDSTDSSYLPRRVVVMGGRESNLTRLNDTTIECDFDGLYEAVVLGEQSEYLECIEIQIKECKDGGCDTRIHAIKIVSSQGRESGFNYDSLSSAAIAEFPLLDGFDIGALYQKAIATYRLLKLLDSVLSLLVPRWEYSLAPFASLETARELLTLSKKRNSLIEHWLSNNETTSPSAARKVHIDRQAGMEHRSNPGLDVEYRKSIFNQLFESLKPREAGDKPYDYRWPIQFTQWWECKFIGEGIIDQGGGFRDSLSDLAEEICPSSSDSPLPLPFFIRSPNQTNEDASNYRDQYIPNPSCTEFHKYEWIGKLMGACFRGKENLVLSLSQFVWKSLLDRPVSWQHDFITVDEAQVKLIESMKAMNKEEYEAYFSGVLTWSVTLSNGTLIDLTPANGDSSTGHVLYDDRLEYAQLVEDARMNESKQQVQAIRNGLMQVVPEAALELFTWHEVEKRICGDPEIPLETLRKHIVLDSLPKDDSRIKMLWEVLEKFTNEDRSHFLRFVSGRRRLPATVNVQTRDTTDMLPTSSTCGSTLYLPRYTSAKVMEEKLRYAAYNCIAIDNDGTANTAERGSDYYF